MTFLEATNQALTLGDLLGTSLSTIAFAISLSVGAIFFIKKHAQKKMIDEQKKDKYQENIEKICKSTDRRGG